MIKRFLPSVLLVVLGWLSVLACVGALAASLAIWLASLWGPIVGTLVTALVFAILAGAFFLFASIYTKGVTRQYRPSAVSEKLGDTAQDFFRSHPAGIMAGVGLLAYLLIRRPGIFARASATIAKSTAFVMMLRRLL